LFTTIGCRVDNSINVVVSWFLQYAATSVKRGTPIRYIKDYMSHWLIMYVLGVGCFTSFTRRDITIGWGHKAKRGHRSIKGVSKYKI
jgi:hypothetical protein